MSKLTITLSDHVDSLLGYHAYKDSISKMEVLRRAMALYDYVANQARNGTTLALINEKGKIKVTITI